MMVRPIEKSVTLSVAQNEQSSIGVYTATRIIWNLCEMVGNRATTRKRHFWIAASPSRILKHFIDRKHHQFVLFFFGRAIEGFVYAKASFFPRRGQRYNSIFAFDIWVEGFFNIDVIPASYQFFPLLLFEQDGLIGKERLEQRCASLLPVENQFWRVGWLDLLQKSSLGYYGDWTKAIANGYS